jgi:hypothetical protein
MRTEETMSLEDSALTSLHGTNEHLLPKDGLQMKYSSAKDVPDEPVGCSYPRLRWRVLEDPQLRAGFPAIFFNEDAILLTR